MSCLDCFEFTWNWQKVHGCIGNGVESIKPCEKFKKISNEGAKRRVEALGPPGATK